MAVENTSFEVHPAHPGSPTIFLAGTGIGTLGGGDYADDVAADGGFDEGPVHPDWKGWNEERKKKVEHLSEYQERAVKILKSYREREGLLYNS